MPSGDNNSNQDSSIVGSLNTVVQVIGDNNQIFTVGSESTPYKAIRSVTDKIEHLMLDWDWDQISSYEAELVRQLASGTKAHPIVCDALIIIGRVEIHTQQVRKAHHLPLDLTRLRRVISEIESLSIAMSDEQHSRFVSLRAIEHEFAVDADAAIQVLGPPTNPIKVRTFLGILMRADRHAIAATYASSLSMNAEWIEFALRCFAENGDHSAVDRCNEFVDQANDPRLMWRSRAMAADGYFSRILIEARVHSPFEISEWNGEHRALSEKILELLEPVESLVKANRRVGSELQSLALACSAGAGWILQREPHWRWCGNQLQTYSPVPIVIAELSLRKLITCHPNLPTRLRIEHAGRPDEFSARRMAAILDRDIFHRHDESFRELEKLAELAETDQHKLSLCAALFEGCGLGDVELPDRASRLIQRLQPDDTRLLGFVEIIKVAITNGAAAADPLVELRRDENDGTWWQLRATVFQKLERFAEAEIAWKRASELIPDPEIIDRSIHASLQTRQYANAEQSLTRVQANSPNDLKSLDALASVRIHLRKFEDTIPLLRRLVQLKPDDAKYKHALAQCLARTNQVSEALTVLRPLCEESAPSHHAVLMMTELLDSEGSHAEALNCMGKIAEQKWDDPPFLIRLMNQAYRAGDELRAHQAFIRLQELREEGKVPLSLMREGTIDELLEHRDEYIKRQDKVRIAVIRGEIPWLFAEDVLNQTATWAWISHTQPLHWLSEEPIDRAAFSVYSTNGVNAATVGERKRLKSIRSSLPSNPIVVDISSLVTLHALQRIEKVADFYGAIILPSSYGDARIQDASKLDLHQASRERQLKRIRSCLANGVIRLSNVGQELTLVDEYSDPANIKAYHIRDVLDALAGTQRLTATMISEAQSIAHLPAASPGNAPSLRLGDRLEIDLLTLRTLSLLLCFDIVCRDFTLFISQDAKLRLDSELDGYTVQRAAWGTHKDMWKAVAMLQTQNRAFFQSPSRIDTLGGREDDDSDEEDSEDELATLHLDSWRLAVERRSPLLVDDRRLQVQRLHFSTGLPDKAFSSHHAIIAMLDAGVLTIAEAAGDLSKLLKWRFRFLIIPPKVLMYWALEARGAPPGTMLVEVAHYLHECLRDPGLFCGLESTEPPVPIAVDFVSRWGDAIAEFLALIWSDNDFTLDQSRRITIWAGEEFVPSCPRGLFLNQIGHNLARFEPKCVLMQAMMRFISVPDLARANLGLRCFASAIGLSESEFFVIATEAAVTASTGEAEGEYPHPVAVRMAENAIFHIAGSERGLAADNVLRLQSTGQLLSLRRRASQELIDAIRKEEIHPPRTPTGPYRLVWSGNQWEIVELASLLLHDSRELRAAAIDAIQRDQVGTRAWLTPLTVQILNEQTGAATSNEVAEWRPAVLILAERIRRDFFGLLAGCVQSALLNFREGWHHNISAVLHPSYDSLAYCKPPMFNPSALSGELDTTLDEISSLTCLEEALTEYLNRLGFVPLCQRWSAATLVAKWRDKHPTASVDWKLLISWAQTNPQPFAHYHALQIAVHDASLRPEDDSVLASEMLHVMEFGTNGTPSDSLACKYSLANRLGLHYLMHIELLQPGQVGVRAACSAWWITGLVLKAFSHSRIDPKNALLKLVNPGSTRSIFQWTVARSPIDPSPLRFGTLVHNSIWAQSLYSQLKSESALLQKLSSMPTIRDYIRTGLFNHLAGGIAGKRGADEVTFAFESTASSREILEYVDLGSTENPSSLLDIVASREFGATPEGLRARLAALPSMKSLDQRLTLIWLKEIIFSGNNCDEAIISWLSQVSEVIRVLDELPLEHLDLLIDSMLEFQQRLPAETAIRLPHYLNVALENTTDQARAESLLGHIVVMSINIGVASPIERIWRSKWLPAIRHTLEQWRSNLLSRLSSATPWVAGRLRSCLATFSRMIGPRDVSPHEFESIAMVEETDQEE